LRWKLTWRSRARWLPPKCRRQLRLAVALGQHPSRARGRQQQPTKRSNRPKCAPVPETAEAAARLPSVLMASGLRAACESAAMRWLRCQLTWCGRESLHRTSKLSQTLQARSSGGGRLLCFFHLADPTDVGFLDAFFPTAGSREASFHGAWMAS